MSVAAPTSLQAAAARAALRAAREGRARARHCCLAPWLRARGSGRTRPRQAQAARRACPRQGCAHVYASSRSRLSNASSRRRVASACRWGRRTARSVECATDRSPAPRVCRRTCSRCRLAFSELHLDVSYDGFPLYAWVARRRLSERGVEARRSASRARRSVVAARRRALRMWRYSVSTLPLSMFQDGGHAGASLYVARRARATPSRRAAPTESAAWRAALAAPGSDRERARSNRELPRPHTQLQPRAA